MTFLRQVLAAVAVVALAQPAVADAPKRPHIVLLLTDDLGPGDVGCYGGTVVPTPNIDRLAKDGTKFNWFYVAAPVCSPSRCGIITGQFPGRWRITSYLQTRAGNRGCEQADFLDPAAPALPRALKAAGYATAHVGKWHLGGGRDVVNPPKFAAYGYDEGLGTWESPEPDPAITASDWIWSDKDKVKRWDRTGYFVDKALDFLKRHQDRPCYVNLWPDDPHTPWVTPAAPTGKPPAQRDNLKLVMAEVDRQVGRLVAGLKELGIENDTLLIFTSDNGPQPNFDHERTAGLRGGKVSLYEGGTRLPFIARWPGRVPAGAVDDTTVISAVDLFPTFCAVAGAALPAGMKPDGEDRSAALFGRPSASRSRPLFWEYGRNEKFFAYPGPKTGDRSPNVAVRDGNWKLLVNADGSGTELYDLSVDPKEKTNVAAMHADVTERLRAAALAWRRGLP
jgi:arylsulfatase A-like enzyme